MKSTKNLFDDFKPSSYELKASGGLAQLKITGRKTGRPSRRITLHQKSLKITAAKLWRLEKGQLKSIPITRINHLNGVQEVRLHSDEMLYPGQYQVELAYKWPAGSSPSRFDRTTLPSIDEPAAWAEAEVKL